MVYTCAKFHASTLKPTILTYFVTYRQHCLVIIPPWKFPSRNIPPRENSPHWKIPPIGGGDDDNDHYRNNDKRG